MSILGYVKFQGVQNTLERLFLTIQYLDPLKFSHWFSRLSLLRLARVKRMEAKSRSHDDEMLSLVVFWGFAESNYGRYQEHLILTLHETSNDRQVALLNKGAPSIHFVFT